MGTEREIDGETDEPASLRFVGHATAAVVDRASFDLDDIVARRVSYRELVDAGVNPGIAERLRREYSLVWSFEWCVGEADLPRRATRVRNLRPAERSWIAASAAGGDPESVLESARDDHDAGIGSAEVSHKSDAASTDTESRRPLRDRGWPAVDPDEQVDGADQDVCPRCDTELVTYVLDQSESTFCEACGYVGVAADLGSETPAWDAAVDRLLSGE